MRYDRLRSIAAKIQTVADDVASQGERLLSLLRWRDPRATVLCMIIHLVAAIVVYVTPFKVVALLTGFYALRHPRFRRHRGFPSILMNFFRRLPARTDYILWAMPVLSVIAGEQNGPWLSSPSFFHVKLVDRRCECKKNGACLISMYGSWCCVMLSMFLVFGLCN